jgi:hypothetical protein
MPKPLLIKIEKPIEWADNVLDWFSRQSKQNSWDWCVESVATNPAKNGGFWLVVKLVKTFDDDDDSAVLNVVKEIKTLTRKTWGG